MASGTLNKTTLDTLTWFEDAGSLQRVADLLIARLADRLQSENGYLWDGLCEIGHNARYHADTDGAVVAAQAEPPSAVTRD